MDVITLSSGYEATYNASEPGGRNKLSRYVSTLQKELDNSLENLSTLYTTGYYEGASAAEILNENNADFKIHFKDVDASTVATLTRQLVEGTLSRLNAQSHKKGTRQGSAGVHAPGESSTITARGNQGHFLEPGVQYTFGTYGHQSGQAQPWPQGSLDPRHHTTLPGYYGSQHAATGLPPPPPTGYPSSQPGSHNYTYGQGSLSPILPPNYNQMPPPPSGQPGGYSDQHQQQKYSGYYADYGHGHGHGSGYDPSRSRQ